MTRPSWNEYFMELASVASKRSTCTRRQVGCILVQGKRIIATGYNGSLSGAKHCTDVGCLMDAGSCVRTIHAEVNALCQAAAGGAPTHNATCWVTTKPCYSCFKALANAGIYKIYFRETYHKAYPESCYFPIMEQI